MKVLILVMFFLMTLTVLAQTPTPTPTALPGQSVVTAVNSATSALPSALPSGLLMVLAFVISELGMHGIPTSKPLSWFLFLEAIVGAVVLFLQKVQGLLTTLGSALQNTTTPPAA